MTVSWQWCHVGDSVLNVKASMFIIWLHYVRSVLWCRWNLKIAVSLFRLWVRCASGKWWSLLLYFTFFLFLGGGVKKMEGWVEVLEWQDDWLCIVQRDWDFYFWHLYSMFKRGEKSKGLVVIAPPFLINHKMLCICRCVHDVPFPRKEWLTLSGSFQQSHWPLSCPPTPANKHSAETLWYHPYLMDKITQKMKTQSLSTHPYLDGKVG